MRKLNFVWMIGALSGIFLAGCRSTDIKTVRTGLFNDKPEGMLTAYSKVELGLTKSDIEKLGFSFSAPNVKPLDGEEAFSFLFGKDFFRPGFSFTADQVERSVEEGLESLISYQGYVFPYKDVLKKKDRLYWSTKDETEKGKVFAIVLLFKEDVLVFRSLEYVELDTLERNYGFLHGILRFIVPSGNAQDAFEELTTEEDDD